jgi:hypothetical protein
VQVPHDEGVATHINPESCCGDASNNLPPAGMRRGFDWVPGRYVRAGRPLAARSGWTAAAGWSLSSCSIRIGCLPQKVPALLQTTSRVWPAPSHCSDDHQAVDGARKSLLAESDYRVRLKKANPPKPSQGRDGRCSCDRDSHIGSAHEGPERLRHREGGAGRPEHREAGDRHPGPHRGDQSRVGQTPGRTVDI